MVSKDRLWVGDIMFIYTTPHTLADQRWSDSPTMSHKMPLVTFSEGGYLWQYKSIPFGNRVDSDKTVQAALTSLAIEG